MISEFVLEPSTNVILERVKITQHNQQHYLSLRSYQRVQKLNFSLTIVYPNNQSLSLDN